MKTQANGIGGYKRKTSPNGTTGISEASRARMDAAHALCLQRADEVQATQATLAQAAAAYRAEGAGLTRGLVEVQV